MYLRKIGTESLKTKAKISLISLMLCGAVFAQNGPSQQTPWGWKISPVGNYIMTPNFPTKIAVSQNHIFVLTNGATPYQTITMYDKNLNELFQVQTYPTGTPGSKTSNILMIPNQNLFQGLYYSNHKLYAAGGDSDDVLVFNVNQNSLSLENRIPLQYQPFPANQYPYQYQGPRYQNKHFFTSCVYENNGYIYACGLLSNAIARINENTGKIDYLNVGPYPYDITSDGQNLYVSLWGSNSVAVIDPSNFDVEQYIDLGPKLSETSNSAGMHPTSLYYNNGNLFVSLANTNKIAIVNTNTMQVSGYLKDKMFEGQEVGSYPNSILLNNNQVFVSSAGLNAINIFDLSSKKLIGSIPTGWYPSSMAEGPNHNNLYVVSAKGLGSSPNPDFAWVGIQMQGILQKIPFSDINQNLNIYTQDVYNNNNFNNISKDQNIINFLRQNIRYVVFILRENKTFDEELGTYSKAGNWADPNLAVYNVQELPNLFNLANNYTLLANFYVDGETTAQAHEWTTGANISDFVDRTWAQYYSQRGLLANPGWTIFMGYGLDHSWGYLPTGKVDPYAIYKDLRVLGKWTNPWIAYPYKLYLFNNLLKHGVSFEDFGEFVARNREGDIPTDMKKHLAYSFPGWDMFILDTYRAKAVINWLENHPMPQFLYIWLPDDHTGGLNPCYYTPNYYVANNDYATAEILQYLSNTPYWQHMVVFIGEDDAQSGADHIDAHRSFEVVVSPWVKQGYISTQHYSQVNVIKTIEEILGVPPMSIYDQTASVLTDIWTNQPNFSPINAITPNVPVAFNPGYCSNYTLLRREAGLQGRTIAPELQRELKEKQKSNSNPYNINPKYLYGPTSILKVPGFEQFKQIVLATKGESGYKKMMAYIRKLAKSEHKSIWAFIGN